ncbi:MAG: glycosyltransferase family 4 protein [Paraburkholderia sp.]|nr:glycosyltransferase family 4 protein [Paraburkholderia sp.]MDE1184685.1 glycosyltransferase family 4 protein [Paraburkholderia sp.]
MRILIVTHVVAKGDGQGRVNYEIARAALDAGHSVTLLASRAAPELIAHPRARFVKMAAGRLPSKLLQYQLFALRTGLWIRAHREEFDVVHVNGFITWARSDVNSVHFVHDGWYRCGFFPYRFFHSLRDAYQVTYARLNLWLERRAFNDTGVIVPVSAKVGSEVCVHGIDPARLHVIHNGVDTDEFAPGSPERGRFGLPETPFMLLFAGDLRVARKNLDTVLHALAKVPGVHLAVAGTVHDTTGYPAMAASLGIADRVHFIGYQRDMAALMRSVDAFVFPSRYEAMSLVLLEALASALPVITARTAGGAEVIGPDCGIVLDSPDDIEGLAAAIASVSGEYRYAQRLSVAARGLALTLTWQVMANRYLALYARVMERRGAVSSDAVPAVTVARS